MTILRPWRIATKTTWHFILADICKRLFRLHADFFWDFDFYGVRSQNSMTKKLCLVTTILLLFKKQTFTTDKWVVWYVNWYFMTTDNFSATGRLTKTRSGQMNVQKLHQQPTARFRYVGCLLHSKIWITFKIRTKRKFIHPNPTQRKRANR